MPIPFKELPDDLELFLKLTDQEDLLHVLKIPGVMGLIPVLTTCNDAFYDIGNNRYALIVAMGTEYYRLETRTYMSKKFGIDVFQTLQNANEIVIKQRSDDDILEFYFSKI